MGRLRRVGALLAWLVPAAPAAAGTGSDIHAVIARPGQLAAQALAEGDATDVQSRYVAQLSPAALVGELARTLGSLPADAGPGPVAFLQRELLYPYTAGEAFVRALRARGGQRLLDRTF